MPEVWETPWLGIGAVSRARTSTDTYAREIAAAVGNEPVMYGIACFVEKSGGRNHPVGLLVPSGWGLYETAGYVWKWLRDNPGGVVPDPADPRSGSVPAVQGGGRSIRQPGWLVLSESDPA